MSHRNIFRSIFLTAVALSCLSACVGALSNSSTPRYYEVSYPYRSANCTQDFQGVVKIWPFTASSPYDREEMIILDPSRQVRFSPQFRWVTLPGDMVADRLLRDFTQSRLFAGTITSGNPFSASLEMGGHVFRFAWEEFGASARAVLDVEVSVWNGEPKRAVVFRRHYHFESTPSDVKGSSERLAEDMSGLVQQLSRQLQEDLCSELPTSKGCSPTGSLSRAGG